MSLHSWPLTLRFTKQCQRRPGVPDRPGDSDRHGVRKFGFHGLSHRYMLEHYASPVGKSPEELNLVTLHLESGCSACAIHRGRSIDTTMGLTPLEGLMMGKCSGSIDPAIVPYLMRKERKSAEDILELLNKRSGLLGIAGGSIDTRDLSRRSDDPAKLALEMFGYRVRLAVGAYLAALGNAEAVLFGGGSARIHRWLREQVCAGLAGWGAVLDEDANPLHCGHAAYPNRRIPATCMGYPRRGRLANRPRMPAGLCGGGRLTLSGLAREFVKLVLNIDEARQPEFFQVSVHRLRFLG